MKVIIVRPLITEKSMELVKQGKYMFEIGLDANKSEVKQAIKDIYKVDAVLVHTSSRKPKEKRYGKTKGFTPKKKIAIVTLKKDQKIELFEEAK